jgi:hypothetical protein
MRAILLSRDGFWAERTVESLPPIYRVPWVVPNGFDVEAESSMYLPSYGTIDFDRVALDPLAGVGVYLCKGGSR